MSEELPKSIATSTLRIGAAELICHVLDTGERVFEADGVNALLAVMFGDEEGDLTPEDAERLTLFIRGFAP